jgi:ABC-type dipeptide/oligopeptide/nickel transport system permease component
VRAYLLSRLGQTALVIFLALTAVFFLVRLGGDPVILFLPMDIQAKDINEFRQRLGFNDPLIVQYGRFIGAPRSGISANRCATSRTPSASSSSACPPPSRSRAPPSS